MIRELLKDEKKIASSVGQLGCQCISRFRLISREKGISKVMHICIYVYVWVYVYVCPWTSQCRRYVLELRYTRKYRESSFEQPCVLFLSEAHSFRSFLLLSHAPLFPFLIRVTPTTILHLSHTYLFISHPSTRNSRALLVPNFKFLELSLRFLYIACTWSFFALLKSPFRIRFVIKKTV